MQPERRVDTNAPSLSRPRALLEILIVTAILGAAVATLATEPVLELLHRIPSAYREAVVVFVQGQLVTVLLFVVAGLHEDPWSTLGLRHATVGGVLRTAAVGLVLVGIVLAALVALFSIAPRMPAGARVHALPWVVEELARMPIFLIPPLALFVGFYEELLFRGFFLERLRALFGYGSRGGAALAIVVSSVAFGALHIYKPLNAIVFTCFLGAFLGGMAVRGRQIYSSILVHALLDTVALTAAHLLVVGAR